MSDLYDIPQNEYEPGAFDLIPKGTYAAQVIESDVADTKTGGGKLLKLTLQITEGPFTNRRVWETINIVNRNAEAQKIGQRQFAELRAALGLGPIRNTQELHDRPLRISIKIEEGKDGYEPRNRVQRFMPYAGGQAPAVSHSSPQPAQAQPSAPAQAASPSAAGPPRTRPWA